LKRARAGSLVSCPAYLEGPYVASTAEYRNYENLLLIGGGIGVTPFISILLDMINGSFNSNRIKQMQLHWLVRDLDAARFWFQDLFQSIEDDNGKASNCPSIAVTIWYTKIKHFHNDLSTVMRTVSYMYSDLFGSDLISGITIRSGSIRAEFGRPESWKRVFQSCHAAYGHSKKIGVFCCGPYSLSEELRNVCRSFSPRGTFEYHSEDCF
jgi:predicted ferric reductase